MRSYWPLGVLVILASPADAKDPVRAPQLERLVACKAMADPAARLACYDREVASIDQAEQRNELVIVEKEQVRKARRTLFGLSLPRIDLLAGADNDDTIDQIDGKIASARQGPGGWRVTLEDGSIWQQVDDKPMFRDPKPGDTVIVSRGALGSYFLRVNKVPAIKVRRII
ncbi:MULTISPECIES: hypothetical protein [unclassified Sphingomonas]|uniref:hypothetical protein n=1 Tax=unclassified Sphingomonas TaxID=196159 RepID=UPI0026BA1DCA